MVNVTRSGVLVRRRRLISTAGAARCNSPAETESVMITRWNPSSRSLQVLEPKRPSVVYCLCPFLELSPETSVMVHTRGFSATPNLKTMTEEIRKLQSPVEEAAIVDEEGTRLRNDMMMETGLTRRTKPRRLCWSRGSF